MKHLIPPWKDTPITDDEVRRLLMIAKTWNRRQAHAVQNGFHLAEHAGPLCQTLLDARKRLAATEQTKKALADMCQLNEEQAAVYKDVADEAIRQLEIWQRVAESYAEKFKVFDHECATEEDDDWDCKLAANYAIAEAEAENGGNEVKCNNIDGNGLQCIFRVGGCP